MRRIIVRCTAPVTVREGSYDRVTECDSEIAAWVQANRKNGTSAYGYGRHIRWVLRPDGVHLGIIRVGLEQALIKRYGYKLKLNCGRGHQYDLKPGEMIQCI